MYIDILSTRVAGWQMFGSALWERRELESGNEINKILVVTKQL